MFYWRMHHVAVSVCTGVLVRFGWSRVVSECRLEHSWFVRTHKRRTDKFRDKFTSWMISSKRRTYHGTTVIRK